MKTYIKIISTIIVSLIFTNNSFACSCVTPDTPEQEVEISTNVFLGKVTNISKLSLLERIFQSNKELEVSFDVSWIIKGEEKINITVSTPNSSAACGFEFEKEKDYIVYAKLDEENLKVSLCSRTKLISEADEDIKDLEDKLIYIYKEDSIENTSTGIIEEESEEIYYDSEEETNKDKKALFSSDNIFLLFIIIISTLLLFNKRKEKIEDENNDIENIKENEEIKTNDEIINTKVSEETKKPEENNELPELDIKLGKEINK